MLLIAWVIRTWDLWITLNNSWNNGYYRRLELFYDLLHIGVEWASSSLDYDYGLYERQVSKAMTVCMWATIL